MTSVNDKLTLMLTSQAALAVRLGALADADMPSLRADLAALRQDVQALQSLMLNVQQAIG